MFDETLPTSFTVGCIAAVCTYLLCYVASNLLAKRFVPSATKETLSYVPSLLHALAQTIACWQPVTSSPQHWNNRVTYFDDALYATDNSTGLGPAFWSGIFVGYLLADLVVESRRCNWLMVAHHIFASVAWTHTVSTHSLQWYQCFLQFNELSTIFLSLRKILIGIFGFHKSSPSILMVNFLTFVTFAAVRVLPLPMVLYHYWMTDMEVLHSHAGATSFYLIWGMLTFHTVMQTYWFGLMIKLLLSICRGAQRKEASIEKRKRN